MKYAKRIITMLLITFVVLFSFSCKTVSTVDHVEIIGTVALIQKYGNLEMDIKPQVLYDAGFDLGDILMVTVGNNSLDMPFCTSYADVDTGNLVARDAVDNDVLIIAINMGDFAGTYKVQVGDSISFSLKQKEGYLAEYQLRQLTRTNSRSDYASDSIFANFRSITTTGIKPAVLYRSSSPADDGIARAQYANALTEAVGIQAVLNFADSNESLEAHIASKDYTSAYYKNLYNSGKVINLNMGVDIAGKDFGSKLAEGLRFMANNEGPYLIHCLEGKDRAGFVSALLEALMGAPLDEIVADYMLTFENYYKVERGSEQYNSIAQSNIIASITTVLAGQKKGSDISNVNLASAAEKYLSKNGLTAKEIKALKEKLSVDSKYKMPHVSATIIDIEKYGHAQTSILIDDFNKTGIKFGDMTTVIFDNGFILEAPYLDNYYVEDGYPLVRAYPGHKEIAVCINYGKLNEIADVEPGNSLTIMLSAPQKYLVQYEIRKLERTNIRSDYTSDEVFANFREIHLGSIAKGKLFRSSSPINNELGRAAYSDALIKKAQIKTVINLADSQEDIKKYLSAEDFASPYYASLYENNRVLPLSMGMAYTSPDFKANVIKGLVFMAENEAPYNFHCTEGKDRAGFFAALIEALMGASPQEIVEDYMYSYENYYGVEKGTDKYTMISGDVIAMLKHIAGSEDLNAIDLAAQTEKFVIAYGMTTAQVQTLKKNLSNN